MRIGVDARFLTHPQPGGFKTYSENLIAALTELDAVNEYLLYVDRRPAAGLPLLDRPNVAVRVVAGTLPVVGMPWREQVGLAWQAARDRLDLLHAPSLTAPLFPGCPLVVTIHDMIWRFPEQFAQGKAAGKRQLMQSYYRYAPAAAARRAAAVLTVSHAAKADIVAQLGLPPERVTVTHNGLKPIYRPIADRGPLVDLRRRYDLEMDFILAIGSADPRKNLVTLLHAYAALPAELRQRYQLAIVWTHQLLAAGLAEQAAALGIADRLRFLQRVSDADLALLYNAAGLFVFPSRYEGFGLPLLEAMACGVPVVAADNSSIPEIAGDAALLVPAQDAAAMSGAMAQVLNDVAVQEALIRRGVARAAHFSWARCARETHAVYEQVAAQAAQASSYRRASAPRR